MFPSTMPGAPGSPDAANPLALLSQLKSQAKALLKAFRADDPLARARVATQLPRFTQAASASQPTRQFALADALHVIAREQGSPSWPRLKAQIVAQPGRQAGAQLDGEAPVAAGQSSRSGEAGASSALATGQTTHTPSSRERAAQAAALYVELARAGQIERLARLLTSRPRRETLAIRDAIVARGEQSVVVDALLVGLGNADSRIRFDCAHALDHYADERCAGPLRRLLDDPAPRVRRMALHSLSCDVCKVAPLPTGMVGDAEDDLVALVVAHALRDPSVNVRRHATSALGACCGDPRARDTLVTLLATETDPAILRNARWALRAPKAATPRPRL